MIQSKEVSPIEEVDLPHIIFPYLEDKKVYLNTLYKVTVDNTTEVIYDEGARSYIADLITANINIGDPTSFMSVSKRIVEGMDWALMNKQGSLLTRLSAFVHKKLGENLSQVTKSKIDEYVKTLFPASKEYYFDIDVSLNWLQGEFGDNVSCFFDHRGEGGGSFEHLRETEGYYSVRFFKPFPLSVFPENSLEYIKTNYPFSYYIEGDTIYRGYARNWMRYGQGVNYPVIFNSYGHTTRTTALVLKEFLGSDKLAVTDVQLRNTNLYNNGDGIEIHPKVITRKNDFTIDCQSKTSRRPFTRTDIAKKMVEHPTRLITPKNYALSSSVTNHNPRGRKFADNPFKGKSGFGNEENPKPKSDPDNGLLEYLDDDYQILNEPDEAEYTGVMYR